MREYKNLKTWIEEFKNGSFDDEGFKTQVKAGWFDWNCKYTSLRNKTYKMGSIIKQIKDGGKVDLEYNFVSFKNHYSARRCLYDSFEILCFPSGYINLIIDINNQDYDERYIVFGRTPDRKLHFKEPIFKTNFVKDLVKWLNTPWEV